MMLNSTSARGSKVLGAALAASCLVGTSIGRAEPAASVRVGGDQIRLFSGKSSDWDVSSPDGHMFFYVEDIEENRLPEIVRQTTDQEHLIATLRALESRGGNWDGEGALAPVVSSLRAASDFACLLPSGSEMPEPLLHADGSAGLSWVLDDYYGELEFLGERRIAYYFEVGTNKHKGVVAFADRTIPAVIGALLPT